MLRLVLLVIALTSTPLLAEQERWQNLGFISKAFTEVALRNEYSLQGSFVRNWHKPVKVWIDHQVADQDIHTGLVKMHIKHLIGITGQQISLTERENRANLKIIFTRQQAWKEEVGKEFGPNAIQHVHGAVCMANFSVNGHYEIQKAVVIIPVDQARMHGKLVSCIVEEITQVLGLPNDSEKAYPSIFNDKTPESLLSGLDYLLLKALYHDDIRAGMSEDEVMPLLQKLLWGWQKDGTIQSAAKSVKNGELYPLLGY